MSKAQCRRSFSASLKALCARLLIGGAGSAHHAELRDAVEQAQFVVKRVCEPGREFADLEESDCIALRVNAGLLRDLRNAISEEAPVLHFQLKLNLRSSTIDSIEALVRWNYPVNEAVSRAHFIPLAEESGDIRALTYWAFAAACRASATLQAKGLDQPIYVAFPPC